jgi:uncharacterized protein with HEPN domain
VLQPLIPWPQIAAMSNILRHEYHRVSDPVAWNVLVDYLPPLRAAVLEIMAGLGEDENLT